ncbi:MAG: hypothetical protein HYR96_15205 [Deltaproteobacteria bacterium]|nr:hypothetical protein [Deltaproteobacteria bacterium]MBI3293340.1 hypothetical protein [Deltaproteobacteria bacterium]
MSNKVLGLLLLGLSRAAMAATVIPATDIPGGMTRSAERFAVGSYQLVVSPAMTISPGGAYLTSELRHQTNEEMGVGFGFGAGEIGFNFGFNGVWHLMPDSGNQPAVAVLGGLYLNRIDKQNWFALRLAPMISKAYTMDWGRLTPYAALTLTPSFRLGEAQNGFSTKASMGTEFNFAEMKGVRFWTEIGVGLVNSEHEAVLGIAYPFDELAG